MLGKLKKEWKALKRQIQTLPWRVDSRVGDAQAKGVFASKLLEMKFE